MNHLEEITKLGKHKGATVAAMVANLISNDPSPHVNVMAQRSAKVVSFKGNLPPKLEKVVRRAINKKGK
jgi:hypothetical protein